MEAVALKTHKLQSQNEIDGLGFDNYDGHAILVS